MTDRELLESAVGEETASQYTDKGCAKEVSREYFWLELDDALAKRGWWTALYNRQIAPDINFLYECSVIPSIFRAQGATRIEAVRLVYEQIIAATHTEEESNGIH